MAVPQTHYYGLAPQTHYYGLGHQVFAVPAYSYIILIVLAALAVTAATLHRRAHG